ncbi:S-adenosyl-L-methionine-dependent methyltransferase [Nemania sp. FL0031]|nr:S-adenosyl-L-methionine-dependent methyltransferase [Nemania sp. FL0031]
MAFFPKQFTKYQAEHLAELQGNVSETAAKYCLTLIPPFKTGDVVHDNACGYGAVTQSIMAASPPPAGIHIHATDINPKFVQGVERLAKSKSWTVTAAAMPAEALTFENNKFTHSITGFAFHCIDKHYEAAGQIYRTLQPGGVAIATVWDFMPHVAALQHAHWKTRGEEAPMPTLLAMGDYEESKLRDALKAGGFTDENISCTETTAHLKVLKDDLKRWAQLAWSYLGAPPGDEWSQHDEDHWDEAINDIVEQLQSGNRGITSTDGEIIMEMHGVVAVAKK